MQFAHKPSASVAARRAPGSPPQMPPRTPPRTSRREVTATSPAHRRVGGHAVASRHRRCHQGQAEKRSPHCSHASLSPLHRRNIGGGAVALVATVAAADVAAPQEGREGGCRRACSRRRRHGRAERRLRRLPLQQEGCGEATALAAICLGQRRLCVRSSGGTWVW